MFASVLGMALSIEFGIARTFALGVGFYAVCALMIVVSRRESRIELSAAGLVEEARLTRPDEAACAAASVAPSIQPMQIELAGDISTKSATMPPRADEVAEV
jgi:hypothetical protein